MKSNYKTINVKPEHQEFLKNISLENSITLLELMDKIIFILKCNKDILNWKEEDFGRSDEILIDKFRKAIVKENNRILGFYLENEKILNSIHRDIKYYHSESPEDKFKLHPFWSEYDLQINTFRKYFMKKLNIKNEDKFYSELLTVLSKNEVEDFKDASRRTKSKRLDI